MQFLDLGWNGLRQPIALPFFGQLELVSGKSRIIRQGNQLMADQPEQLAPKMPVKEKPAAKTPVDAPLATESTPASLPAKGKKERREPAEL